MYWSYFIAFDFVRKKGEETQMYPIFIDEFFLQIYVSLGISGIFHTVLSLTLKEINILNLKKNFFHTEINLSSTSKFNGKSKHIIQG